MINLKDIGRNGDLESGRSIEASDIGVDRAVCDNTVNSEFS